ncbi:hypothetical protein GQ457_01G023180 [Hibiscus cannabinus]
MLTIVFFIFLSLGGFNHPVANGPRFVGYMRFGFTIFIKEGIDCSLDLATPLTNPINEESLRKSFGDQFDRLSAQPSSSLSVPIRAPTVTCSNTAVERIPVGSALIRLVIPYGPRHSLG